MSRGRPRSILILSKVFFLELLREKLILGGVIVGIVLFLLSLAMGALSLDERERIVFHLSMTAIQTVGVFLAIIYGSSSLAKEIEKQTCLLVLSRPVSRMDFFISKAISLFLFLLMFDLLLGFLIYGLVAQNYSLGTYVVILWGTLLEQTIVLLLALASSLVLRKSVAVFFVFGIWLLGHWLPDLAFFAKKSENPVFQGLTKALDYLIPHFYELNWRTFQLLKEGLDFALAQRMTLHALGWIIVITLVGGKIWQRRDLV